MSLERRIGAQQIVIESGMSNRPEYYSGRGATISYLNDKILEKTYQIVQREHGEVRSRRKTGLHEDWHAGIQAIPRRNARPVLGRLLG